MRVTYRNANGHVVHGESIGKPARVIWFRGQQYFLVTNMTPDDTATACLVGPKMLELARRSPGEVLKELREKMAAG